MSLLYFNGVRSESDVAESWEAGDPDPGLWQVIKNRKRLRGAGRIARTAPWTGDGWSERCRQEWGVRRDVLLNAEQSSQQQQPVCLQSRDKWVSDYRPVQYRIPTYCIRMHYAAWRVCRHTQRGRVINSTQRSNGVIGLLTEPMLWCMEHSLLQPSYLSPGWEYYSVLSPLPPPCPTVLVQSLENASASHHKLFCVYRSMGQGEGSRDVGL